MRAIHWLSWSLLAGVLSVDTVFNAVVLFDLAIGVGYLLAPLRVHFFNAFAEGVRSFFLDWLNAMDDIVMGYIGATASWLQRSQGRARSLLLDHRILSRLLGTYLQMLLAESFRSFLPLCFGVVMSLEVLLKRSFDPLALQIQKHE